VQRNLLAEQREAREDEPVVAPHRDPHIALPRRVGERRADGVPVHATRHVVDHAVRVVARVAVAVHILDGLDQDVVVDHQVAGVGVDLRRVKHTVAVGVGHVDDAVAVEVQHVDEVDAAGVLAGDKPDTLADAFLVETCDIERIDDQEAAAVGGAVLGGVVESLEVEEHQPDIQGGEQQEEDQRDGDRCLDQCLSGVGST
jgi:hypothetical protein